jgi:hypothetical protein
MFRDQVKFSFKREISQFILGGLVFIFLMPACAPEKPVSGVLSEQEMIKVLTEIYLLEDKVSHVGMTSDSIKMIFPKFEAKVFEKLNISDSVFDHSMKYYLTNPKKLEHIYAAVVDSLNLKAQSAAPTKEENELPK